MAGTVTLAVRHKGALEVRTVPKQLIELLCRDLGFLETGECSYASDFYQADPCMLAPESYGLMVIDRDTRWLATLQGYATPCFFRTPALMLDERERVSQEAFFKAWESGSIRRVKTVDDDDRTIADLGWEGWSAQQVLDALRQQTGSKADKGKPDKVQKLIFEPAGWTIQHFPGDVHGWLHFANGLLDRDFVVDAHASAQWHEYTSDLLDEPEGKDSAEGLKPVNPANMAAERARRHLDQDLRSSTGDDARTRARFC